MRRLIAAEFARRSTRKTWRATRGQTLLIFALTFTVLIGFMGLAIDSIRIYDMYARMQRAAEAGALAGVIYMPTNYTANLTTSPGDDAVCRAWAEVYKNSFGTGCTPGSAIGSNYCPKPVSLTEIAVCNEPKNPYNLDVSITESIDVLFLGALNVTPLRFTVTAVAQYLPPVQIASDPSGTGGTTSWGTFGECGNSGTSASAACTGSGSRNWAGNINGPGELKEQGDPLVTCEEGPSGPLTSVSDVPATTNPLPNTTYVEMPTNHPQNTALSIGKPPTGCANPDATTVFSGPAVNGLTHAGYAFLVRTYDSGGQAAGNTGIWIWNAPFSPAQPPSCNGRQSTGQTTYDIYYFWNCAGSGGEPYPYYPGVSDNTNLSSYPGCAPVAFSTVTTINPYTCQDPDLMFTVTYSVYQVDLTNPTGGNFIGSFTAYPLFQGSCGNGSYMLLASSALGTAPGCVPSACVSNWCPLGAELGGVPSSSSSLWAPFQLQPGFNYRVMVVASDYGNPSNWNLGWGGHSYSMKLCPISGTTQGNVQTCTPPANTSISGWNLSDTLFDFPGNGQGNGGSQTTEYPLGIISSTYIGRTLDISLYDPGDLIGNAKGVSVYGVVPAIPNVTDPCTATSSQLKAAGYDPTINGASFNFPNGERTAMFNNNIPAIQTSSKNDLIYNGLWVDELITLPANYTDTAWTLCAIAPQLNDSDVLGIKVLALGQSPVHLVQ